MAQKKDILNLLTLDALDAFEDAKRLAFNYGGVVSPLHLIAATIQSLDRALDVPGELTGKVKKLLADRFSSGGQDLLVTRESQAVLREACEEASRQGRSKADCVDLLKAALTSPMVAAEMDPSLIGELSARLESLGHNNGGSLSGLDDRGSSNPKTETFREHSAQNSFRTGEFDSASWGLSPPTSPFNHRVTGRVDSGGGAGPNASSTGQALKCFCDPLSRGESAHPFIGRDREVTAILETLCRKLKSNPLLVGKPGVGKTALVGAVAERLAHGTVPSRLKGKCVMEVSRIKLLADARYTGEIEERLKELLEEVRSRGDVILFFDEIHALLGAGGAAGTGDVASLLKTALSRGDIVCIGATTLAEYYRYIAKDEALARRFSTITIEEPSAQATLEILRGTRTAFESYHGISIDDEVLRLIVEVSSRYLPSRSFPDKAFDLMDKAAAKAALSEHQHLGRNDITETVSEMTGLPLEIMEENQSNRLDQLEEYLNRAVPGQPAAAHDIARVIKIAKLGLEMQPEKPDGIFLFAGAETTGKREMAQALAEFLYGSPRKVIEFDMSQFSEGWSMSRLVGAEPGYVGYGERSGQFTKAVEDNPHSVLLFRNVNLAHSSIQQFLAEAFENGRFTDSSGTQVSISNVTVVMTLTKDGEGARTGPLGFVSDATGELRHPPDDWSRFRIAESLGATIDEVIDFKRLDRQATERIVSLRLEALSRRVEAAHSVRLQFEPTVAPFLADRLASERSGVMRLDRLIQELIVGPFSSLRSSRSGALNGETHAGKGGITPHSSDKPHPRIVIAVKNGNICLQEFND